MANPALAHFAAELRAARGRQRLTQLDLEALSGISHKTIARFENEQSDPRLGQMVALAEALSIPAGQFLPEAKEHIRRVS